MLGNFEPDRRQFKDLTTFAMLAGELFPNLVHGRLTLRASVRLAEPMLDDVVGIGDALEGVSAPPLLSARFAPGLGPQAFRLGWIGEVARIRGWRFAAGAGVTFQLRKLSISLLEPPLQTGEPFEQRKGQLADDFWIGFGQLNELRFAWMILPHSEELNL